MSNNNIDMAVQKGGIRLCSRSLLTLNTGVVTILISEAEEGRRNLVLMWFDLPNANDVHKECNPPPP